MVILDCLPHVHSPWRDHEHHRRLDLVRMRATFLPANFLLYGRERRQEVRVLQRDAVRRENLDRRGKRPIRRYSGVEHVEALRSEPRQTPADVDDQISCRLEAQRRGARVFHERRIEVVVDGRRNHDIRLSQYLLFQVLGNEQVIL